MAKLDSARAKEIGRLGGLAKAENYKEQITEYDGMTFEDIVNTYTTGKDLMDLYRGLMASGKKGSVKATETLLKYLEKKKEDVRVNEFEL